MKSTNFAAVPACALLILCTAGCANSPPSDFFILTPVAGGAASAAAAPGIEPLSLGVGPVKIPEYLNRAQIVTRPGPNRLDVNEFNRWGGSLAPNISSVIAQNLAVLLGTVVYQVIKYLSERRSRCAVHIAPTRTRCNKFAGAC